jgi:formate dehydrogenase subunit beta
MAKKGDLLYAWTTDAALAKKAECGGAVSALLKYALESKAVDAVLAVKRGIDLYEAVPTLISDPKQIDQTAGSLHCGTVLLSKLVANYAPAMAGKKLGVVVKGCDMMGFLEMAKRKQVNLDNVLMIGVNCGGSVSPVSARKMIKEKYGVDPDAVVKEEIDKGQFIIKLADGSHKGISMDELEESGYGRRSNCRRCKVKVPRQADIACGNWGVIGDKAGKATFVEVCSDKGADLVSKAVAANKIAVEPANPKGIEIRAKTEAAMFKLADKWRKKDFTALAPKLWETIEKETARCMKCYACIDNCPVCMPVADKLKASVMVRPGVLPVDQMFHMRRFAHISDSCINCGQCEECCPAEIPLALFSHAIRTEEDVFFEPKLGKAPYSN